jgi:hypothetical protein
MKKLIMFLTASLFVLGSAGAVPKKEKKKSYDQAKKECLVESPSLAGKKLQSCIKKKRK